MYLELTERHVADAVILEFDGRLVLGEDTSLLRNTVRQLLDSGARKLVLNLARCDYVDSAGLGELATTAIRVQRANGQLRLLHVVRRVHDLLTVAQLSPVFNICSDEAEAVNSMR
jgi:anti-sigma B factor antagonist